MVNAALHGREINYAYGFHSACISCAGAKEVLQSELAIVAPWLASLQHKQRTSTGTEMLKA